MGAGRSLAKGLTPLTSYWLVLSPDGVPFGSRGPRPPSSATLRFVRFVRGAISAVVRSRAAVLLFFDRVHHRPDDGVVVHEQIAFAVFGRALHLLRDHADMLIRVANAHPSVRLVAITNGTELHHLAQARAPFTVSRFSGAVVPTPTPTVTGQPEHHNIALGDLSASHPDLADRFYRQGEF